MNADWMNKSFNISSISFSGIRGSSSSSKLATKPKWRIITLSMMGITLVILVVATMSTNWREDLEDRYDIFITHGLWRVCRDIHFGSTVDHQCSSKYANDAPSWFQAVRTFMMIAIFACVAGFGYAVYLITNLPVIKNKNFPNIAVTFALPGLFYLLAALCVLVGSGTYSVATAMDQALYFPENLPPTWGDSWAQVLAIRNTIPPDLPDVMKMKMSYGYSFGLAWFSLVTTLASGVVNFIASVP